MKNLHNTYNQIRIGSAIVRILFVYVLLSTGYFNARSEAPVPLISAKSQVEGITDSNLSNKNFEISATSEYKECEIEKEFTVTFPEHNPLKISPTTGLVVYFSRGSNKSAPTAVQVDYLSGAEYKTLGYAYLLYRGGETKENGTYLETHEFSDKIYSPTELEITKLKFTVLSGSGTVNPTYFCKFNLFAIPNGEPYPAGREDPLHAINDYSKFYKNYKYKPNRGILDKHNWYGKNKEHYENILTPPWGDDNEIEWNKVKLELPTFAEQPNKKEITSENTQMPHTIETTLYAMPGDVISLSPFYDLPSCIFYTEKYSHWYGYNPQKALTLQCQEYKPIKDKRNNYLLDFLIDPAAIIRTDDAGFFAGENFPLAPEYKCVSIEDEETKELESYYIIKDFASFQKFIDQVNAGDSNLNAILAADIDCSGKKIKIGTAENPYCGKFNGNGYALKYPVSEVFSAVGHNAKIYNLQVIGSSVGSGTSTGILVDRVYNSTNDENPSVTIKDVIVTGIIINESTELKGGIIGEVKEGSNVMGITLDHVVFIGNVYTDRLSEAPNAEIPNGGLIGNLNDNKVTLKSCYVMANVDGKTNGDAVGTSTNLTQNVIQDGLCSFDIKNEGNPTTSIPDYFYYPDEETISESTTEPCHRLMFYNVPQNKYNQISVFLRTYTDSNREFVFNTSDHWINVSKKMNDLYYYSITDKPQDKGAWDRLTDPVHYENNIDSKKWVCLIHWILPDIEGQENQNDILQNTAAYPINYIPRGYKDVIFSNIPYVGTHPSTPIPIPVPLFERLEIPENPVYEGNFSGGRVRRWYGTEATFYQPLNTKYAPTSEENLKLEQEEYCIAADFAHEFSPFNLEFDAPKIDGDGDGIPGIVHEPVLAYRHIFHIKDGKTFADAYTADHQKNLKYISDNARSVSARSGYEFQIRLSSQIPVENQSNNSVPVKTNFYYKKGDNVYERVPRVGIAVFNKDGDPIPAGEFVPEFKFDAPVKTQGYRDNYPDEETFGTGSAKYYTGNGVGEIYRTLFCKAYTNKETEGKTYVVRLVAKDIDGNTINILDTDEPLYLDEFHITFLKDEEASVLPENALYNEKEDERKFYYHSPEYLKTELGDPAVMIDFDQYCQYEENPEDYKQWFIKKVGDGEGQYVKWPMPWYKSTYSFGYGGYYDYDYNEYVIASHSDQVKFNSAASDHLNPDGSNGLYDRLWYDSLQKKPQKETQKQNPGLIMSATDESETEEEETEQTKDEYSAKSGYFFYVNAASDPGVAAKLSINHLCPGSTVCVSAWVAEMSTLMEVANLCFNFVAVDPEGNREYLHSFVTGYIDNVSFESSYDRHKKTYSPTVSPNHGEWMHIYYSFMPQITNLKKIKFIDHYELELENNCVSSEGADYAVDDIKAYIIPPDLEAIQLGPVCDANQKTTGIRIKSRYDNLLTSLGLERAKSADDGKEVDLYFAVLDKEKYDNIYNNVVNIPDELTRRQEAVKSSIKTFNSVNGDKWVKNVKINSYFDNIPKYEKPDYEKDEKETYGTAMRETKDKVDYFLLNVLPYDDDLHVGKEYYIVLYEETTGQKELTESTYPELFGITDDPCDKYCVVRLQGSGIFKVDGYAHKDDDPVHVCVGQSPVIQVELKMAIKDKDKDKLPDSYDAYLNAPEHYYDWYTGTLKEFMKSRTEENVNDSDNPQSYSYYNLLRAFRKDYPDATELPATGTEAVKYSHLIDLVSDGSLVLHQSSFVYPPITDPGSDHTFTLTAIPILPELDDEEESYKYTLCSQPNELTFHVLNSAPLMHDGFDAEGIDYGDLTDVPLRIGYEQLTTVATLDDLNGNVEGKKFLELPLRNVTSYKDPKESAEMTKAHNQDEIDPFVYLAGTNDPAYIGLNKHPLDKEAVTGLLPIGVIDDLTAATDNNRKNKNNVTIVFSKDMQFSEGYWYTLRFNYDQDLDYKDNQYCTGNVVFTLKIVPAYMKWTGAESRNWNNDANWSRVTKEELNVPEGKETLCNGGDIIDYTKVEEKTKRYEKVDNEETYVSVPGTPLSYVPMDFTRVIIPDLNKEVDDNDKPKSTKGYPIMFKAGSKNLIGYNWNDNADNERAGLPTALISLDMASLNSDTKVSCRPWYANTCNEIHFASGSEILDQQHFEYDSNYKKAWVDMEMTSNRWYTLGLPLQSVVAGDMYTKSTGVENAELFKNISFIDSDNPVNNYNRYDPAVYQRGWNKESAKIYFYNDKSHDYKSVAEDLNWSRVYNDVNVDYSPGIGFSIRTALGKSDERKKVLFRLPKSDQNYDYFTSDGKTEIEDHTGITRTNEHRLYEFTNIKLKLNTKGYFFLVGNPLMAHLNMAKFFEHNRSTIENIYWIMTEERKDVTMWDEKSNSFMTTDPNGDVYDKLPPMQGFFVKANNPTTELELVFTPDMIDEDSSDVSLKIKSRGTDMENVIVTALDDEGIPMSRALINIDSEASAEYVSSEDAPLLIDRTIEMRPTVYSVASEQALAINRLDSITETEIGVYSSEDNHMNLLFEGVEMKDLQLIDMSTGESCDLTEGMTVEVNGSVSGRFYITRKAKGLTEPTLVVVCNNRKVNIVSTDEGVTAHVYSPDGMLCGEWSTDKNAMEFAIDPGIFIVEVVSNDKRVTRKFVVK